MEHESKLYLSAQAGLARAAEASPESQRVWPTSAEITAYRTDPVLLLLRFPPPPPPELSASAFFCVSASLFCMSVDVDVGHV